MYAYTRLRNGSVKLTKDQVLDMLRAVMAEENVRNKSDAVAYIAGWLGDTEDQEWQKVALDIAIRKH